MRKWLEAKRNKKGFTHQEVANLVGIKRQYYGMIENGYRNPSVNVAKKIANALDFHWTIFFEDQCNERLQRDKKAI